MVHDRASAGSSGGPNEPFDAAASGLGASQRAESLRLDRWLAQATGASRSVVRAWLRARRVAVDRATTQAAGIAGRVDQDSAAVVMDAGLRIALDAVVWLDGERLDPPISRTLMLHKPAGVVSATQDPAWPTVLGLIDAVYAPRLRVVGRLDRDTTGLILLTDDGDYLHRVARPRGAWKRYRVTLDAPLPEAAAASLCRGVALKDDPVPAVARWLEPVPDRLPEVASVPVDRVTGHVWRIAIDEGRYHQVKRMFAAVGARVVALHREAIGALELDATLAPGQWRCLTAQECALALQQVR